MTQSSDVCFDEHAAATLPAYECIHCWLFHQLCLLVYLSLDVFLSDRSGCRVVVLSHGFNMGHIQIFL